MVLSLVEEFRAVARDAAERTALVDAGAALSYDQLCRWADTVSIYLDRYQVCGRAVALVLPNSPGFVALFLGAAQAGAIVAPLHAGYRAQEFEHYLGDMNAAVVLVCPQTAGRVLEASRHLHHKPSVVLVDGMGSLVAISSGDRPAAPARSSQDQPLLLLYTSGSVGPPKRVLRTHVQLLKEVSTLRALFGVTLRDRFLGAAPFAHVNGLVRSMLTAMLGGATLYPIRDFAPRAVLRLISQERLTFFGGVPQMFILLAQTPSREAVDLASLRIVFSSSAPLTRRDNEHFHQAYGLHVRQLYGSTETGTISYNDSTHLEARLESVGRPLPGVALAILDEAKQRRDPGQEGEVAVSSSFAMSAYDVDPPVTSTGFHGELYLTGDLGRLDSAGYLTLTGRKTLMINRGGYKVNPFEVEAAIRQHPKVAEVAVFGIPTPHGDEIIGCAIVASDQCNAEEIIAHCRARIADYKIPSRIDFRERLPKTPTGKVLRDSLRHRE